jgi:hypothetical protein
MKMFQYLEDALSTRSNNAAFAHQGEHEAMVMEAKRCEIYGAFESTLLDHQKELYKQASTIDIDMSIKDRTACYRAGWLDGIALGVTAATRENRY